jgi:hypothetical protein
MPQSLFYLTSALHVSGVTITHLQEHKTTVTTASGNRYTVLLSAAIVEPTLPSVSKTYKNVDRVKGSLYRTLEDYLDRNNKH